MQVASSTSITIVRIIYFTVVLCVYIIVLDLFYLRQLFTNMFSFHFQQRIAILMYMCTHNSQTMVKETNKTINFWDYFVYNMILHWLVIPFISLIFFYWQVFLRQVKATNEITTLVAHFYYTILYCLTNLAIVITFL